MLGSEEFGAGGPQVERVELPLDRQGFLRRECRKCKLPFKVRGTRLDGLLVLRHLAREVPHQNDHEASWLDVTRFCPYCATPACDDAWLTFGQREFLDARAESYGQELRYEILSHVRRTLSANPYHTFVAVKPSRGKRELAAEPDDLYAVPLLCCSERIKVVDTWAGPITCFYCGLAHALVSPPRPRLARLLGGS